MKKYTWFIAVFLLTILSSVFSDAQNYTIYTVAGIGMSGYSGDGGPATAARLHNPGHIVFNKKGEMFFTDYYNNCIRRIDTSGVIARIAGNTTTGFGGDGGSAMLAQFNSPNGLSLDKWGNLYIADEGNNRIRKIDTFGIITTVAGNGLVGYSGDGGPATNARFNPIGTFIDTLGNIYVADYANARIRKINTSGIVTTIAGNGSNGYSGDGGQATAAKINMPTSVAIDPMGNIYFTDQFNHRVRKIDPTGIITTIAGNGAMGFNGNGLPATATRLHYPAEVKVDWRGNILIVDAYNDMVRMVNSAGIITCLAGSGITGYNGDNGPANAASLNEPWGMCYDKNGDLFIADAFNHVIRKVRFLPTYVSDSFKIYVDKYCYGIQVTATVNNFSPGMYVKTYFGDGTKDSSAIISTYSSAIVNHTYMNSGVYSVKQVLYNAGVAIDTFKFDYTHRLCNSFSLKSFYDGNANCVPDTAEWMTKQPATVIIDSNGVTIDTITITSGANYNAFGNTGTIYRFRLVPGSPSLVVTCPTGGIITDTLKPSGSIPKTNYFGVSCSATPGHDLRTFAAFRAGSHRFAGTIIADNTYCTALSTTLTMQLSPKYTRLLEFVPTPTSIVGTTVTWNIGMLSSIDEKPFKISAGMEKTTGVVFTFGDTVMTRYTVDPVSGDVHTSDNIIIRVDTVKSSFDPNDIAVAPDGCIPSGVINLQYTIRFENTGNDTAFNIHVLDTLSPGLDPKSLRIVASTAEMYTSVTNVGGLEIAKFDFPGINLLDSSHHGLCDGAVIFTINTRSGVSSGTPIYARAGIYFDENPVVLTNTATNIVVCPTSVDDINKSGTEEIYPNPAKNEITIKTEQGAYSSVTISNSMGQVMMHQPLNSAQTNVDVKMLPTGLYYVTLRGEGGSVVKKVVKE